MEVPSKHSHPDSMRFVERFVASLSYGKRVVMSDSEQKPVKNTLEVERDSFAPDVVIRSCGVPTLVVSSKQKYMKPVIHTNQGAIIQEWVWL